MSVDRSRLARAIDCRNIQCFRRKHHRKDQCRLLHRSSDVSRDNLSLHSIQACTRYMVCRENLLDIRTLHDDRSHLCRSHRLHTCCTIRCIWSFDNILVIHSRHSLRTRVDSQSLDRRCRLANTNKLVWSFSVCNLRRRHKRHRRDSCKFLCCKRALMTNSLNWSNILACIQWMVIPWILWDIHTLADDLQRLSMTHLFHTLSMIWCIWIHCRNLEGHILNLFHTHECSQCKDRLEKLANMSSLARQCQLHRILCSIHMDSIHRDFLKINWNDDE